MKHVFVLMDNLIISLKDVPKELDTEDKKDEAEKICHRIQKYIHSLKKLVENHKTQEMLDRLEHTHIKAIDEWAGGVKQLLSKFDQLITNLEEDIVKLNHVRENEPEKWATQIGDIVFETKNPISITKFNDIQELGRFVLVRGNDVVAGGIIT